MLSFFSAGQQADVDGNGARAVKERALVRQGATCCRATCRVDKPQHESCPVWLSRSPLDLDTAITWSAIGASRRHSRAKARLPFRSNRAAQLRFGDGLDL